MKMDWGTMQAKSGLIFDPSNIYSQVDQLPNQACFYGVFGGLIMYLISKIVLKTGVKYETGHQHGTGTLGCQVKGKKRRMK